MKSLELKIPPLFLVIIFGILMWCLSMFLPGVIVSKSISFAVAGIVFMVGLAFALFGVLSFKKSDTTVNPMAPQEATSLVTSGVYQITRNPMYVGFLLFLLAWAIYLTNVYALLFSLGFVWYMNQFQIKPEEEMLTNLFGEQFTAYTDKVRRWL